MVSGVALDYYFTHVKVVVTDYALMVEKVKVRILTEERMLGMTQELETTTLTIYMKDNPILSKKESLDKMAKCCRSAFRRSTARML